MCPVPVALTVPDLDWVEASIRAATWLLPGVPPGTASIEYVSLTTVFAGVIVTVAPGVPGRMWGIIPPAPDARAMPPINNKVSKMSARASNHRRFLRLDAAALPPPAPPARVGGGGVPTPAPRAAMTAPAPAAAPAAPAAAIFPLFR